MPPEQDPQQMNTRIEDAKRTYYFKDRAERNQAAAARSLVHYGGLNQSCSGASGGVGAMSCGQVCGMCGQVCGMCGQVCGMCGSGGGSTTGGQGQPLKIVKIVLQGGELEVDIAAETSESQPRVGDQRSKKTKP